MFGLCSPWKTMHAVHSVLSELSIRKSSRRPFYGWLCGLAFAELYPEYVKAGVVEFNSQSRQRRTKTESIVD
jgi:hypothetical protein